MTISKVEVDEYQCILCGYKWINRINGKNGPVPERCAKCKRNGWNGEKSDPITPKEAGLRTRIKNLYRVYHISIWRLQSSPYPDFKTFTIEKYWNIEVVAKFLTLDNPRPTIAELRRVLYPPGLVLGLNSQNVCRKEAWIPDPQKPGWLKHEWSPYKEYLKLVQQDAQKQQEVMRQIIKEREQQQGHTPLQEQTISRD